VLPVEITHEAPRIAGYDETTSTEALQDDVDALEKARDVALARATQYQQSLQNYHSSRVHPRSFMVGDCYGVDGFSPSSWEPQEEGMMNIAASFSLSKKPRFVNLEKVNTPEGDAC
jgi:hypothetical protein